MSGAMNVGFSDPTKHRIGHIGLHGPLTSTSASNVYRLNASAAIGRISINAIDRP